MSATTINITKQSDGTWQGSFTSTGTRTVLQVVREENAPLFLKISADNGLHNVIYQPPRDYKDQILSIDIAEGALVTIVSHSAVTKAQYIASSLDYYTKDEVDELLVGIHQFEPVAAQVLPTASEDTMYKIYFIPKSGGGETGNASNEYITVRSGTEGSYTYSWELIGDTAVDISGKADKLAYDSSVTPSSGTASVTFPSNGRKYYEISSSADLTLNITANNSDENYILVNNSGSSNITVTIGTVSYGSTALTSSNVLSVDGGIVCHAGKSVEISVIVFSGKAIVSCSGDLKPVNSL